MSQIQGVIDRIWTKQKPSPKTGKTMTLYYCMVDGAEYALGFRTFLKEGQYVTLDVEPKFGEMQAKVAGAPQPSVAVVPQRTPPPPKVDFPVPNGDKGVSICRQSSLNRAIETVALQGTKFKSREDLVAEILEIAYEYTDFVTGQREVKQAQAMQAYEEQAQEA